MPKRTVRDERAVSTIARVVGQLTAAYPRYFSTETMPPVVSSVTVRPRRLSDIARVELNFNGSTRTLYVKVHKKPTSPIERVRQKARLEFDTLSYLHERFRSVPDCSVPRPVAFFPDEMAVVTDGADGENLHRLIKTKAVWWRAGQEIATLRSLCRACGVWLRHFQECTSEPRQAPLPTGEVLERLRADLDICTDMGLRDADAARLLGVVLEELRELEGRDFPVVGEHPDFQPDNVLCSPAGVTVLDFTSFRHGSPFNDPGRFLAALEFLPKNPLYRPQHVRMLMAAFLHGYGAQPHDIEAGLTVYLVRYLIQAVAAVRSWPYAMPLRRLVDQRAVGFLSGWSRRLIKPGTGILDGIR